MALSPREPQIAPAMKDGGIDIDDTAQPGDDDDDESEGSETVDEDDDDDGCG